MKKILHLFVLLVLMLTVFACKTNKRVMDPELRGVVENVSIKAGDTYDPLSGVTAYDPNTKTDVTKDIKTDFNTEWLNQEGNHEFNISITINYNNQEKTVTKKVSLVVGKKSEIVIDAPDAITYYIGSRKYDPLEEVKAYDAITKEEVARDKISYNKEDEGSTFSFEAIGNYSYEVSVTDDSGKKSSKTVKLYVKELKEQIPNELPKDKEIEITLWHANGNTIQTVLEKYAKEFTENMSKDGYKVKVNIVKNGETYDELKTNVVNAIKGSTLPNIVQNYPDHVIEYNSYNVILPITPYIYHPIYGYDPDDEKEKFTDIMDSYRKEQRSILSTGDYISLPFNKSTEVATYNKTVFDLVLNGSEMPKTWQGLFALSDELAKYKDQNIANIKAAYAKAGDTTYTDEVAQTAKDKFVPFVYDSVGNAFITLTKQFGGEYTSRDQKGKGQVEFINDNTKAMLEYFGSLRGKTFTVPKYWGEKIEYSNKAPKGSNLYSIGSTGGIEYNLPVINGYKLYDVEVAAIPYDEKNPSLRTVIQQGANMSLFNSGDANQKIVSWLFLKYLTSYDVQSDFALERGYSPIRNSVYELNEDYKEFLTYADKKIADDYSKENLTVAQYETLFKKILKAKAAKVAMEQRNYQFFDTPFIGSSKTREEVGNAFERVILAKSTETLTDVIKNALDAAKAESEKLYE